MLLLIEAQPPDALPEYYTLTTASTYNHYSNKGRCHLRTANLTSDVGTARYMAPEVLFGPYDKGADIYSFGVLLWETLHLAVLFSEVHYFSALIKVQGGQRPPIRLPVALAAYAPLIERCWHPDPGLRPDSMSVVVTALEDLLAEPQGFEASVAEGTC